MKKTPSVRSPWMNPGASKAKVPAAQRASMASPAMVSRSIDLGVRVRL
jgi:hypothetical protein